MMSIHHISGLNFFHTVEFGMKQHALIYCIIIQDYSDTTDVWQDNTPLQYILLLRELLILKFIDNCLQCLGRITTPVTIKWV